MICIVTAGPTYEPIDQVRRITNFSTGRLGTLLAAYLATQGFRVKLLRGEMSTYRLDTFQQSSIEEVISFTTTMDLMDKLAALADAPVGAVFHVAAVSDFRVRSVLVQTPKETLVNPGRGKIPTSWGSVTLELEPTPKVISRLREWFKSALIVGWKFEVDGTQSEAIESALAQITAYRTNACVVNGPAYGAGFGLVRPNGECIHLDKETDLFVELEKMVRGWFVTKSS